MSTINYEINSGPIYYSLLPGDDVEMVSSSPVITNLNHDQVIDKSASSNSTNEENFYQMIIKTAKQISLEKAIPILEKSLMEIKQSPNESLIQALEENESPLQGELAVKLP